MELRRWQQQAITPIHNALLTGGDALLAACPGSGKTRFAVAVARRMLNAAQIARLVVVVPSTQLKTTWAKQADKAGIDVTPQWGNHQCSWPTDFQGVAITYQQLTQAPQLIARHAADAATLVVLDEIHHADREDGSWGWALQAAIGGATARLALSGTPWRTAGTPIPFIHYDEQGVAQPTFSYSYQDALADGDVVRPVYFPGYEGEMTWLDGHDARCHTFDDVLDLTDESRRLRVAIDADTQLMHDMIADADDEITARRDPAQEHPDPDAGGLIVATDQRHARTLADTLARVAGEAPVLALSDDPEAHRAIDLFRNGQQRWLVAVKLCSEGTDIPRLRVGVWATNTLTALFFEQVVGRVLRWRKDRGGEQPATFFLPNDARLAALAAEFGRQRDRGLAHRDEVEEVDASGEDRDAAGPRPFEPIAAEGRLRTVMAGHSGDIVDDRTLALARRFGPDVGFHTITDQAKAAALIAQLNNASDSSDLPAHRDYETADEGPRYERIQRLRQRNHKAIRRLAYQRGTKDYEHLNRHFNSLVGVRSVDQATEEQLTRRLELVKRSLVWDTEAAGA